MVVRELRPIVEKEIHDAKVRAYDAAAEATASNQTIVLPMINSTRRAALLAGFEGNPTLGQLGGRLGVNCSGWDDFDSLVGLKTPLLGKELALGIYLTRALSQSLLRDRPDEEIKRIIRAHHWAFGIEESDANDVGTSIVLLCAMVVFDVALKLAVALLLYRHV